MILSGVMGMYFISQVENLFLCDKGLNVFRSREHVCCTFFMPGSVTAQKFASTIQSSFVTGQRIFVVTTCLSVLTNWD